MGQARTGKYSGARNGRVIMHLDMDAIHRKYSRESLKPASGVAGPEQKAEEKAGQKAK